MHEKKLPNLFALSRHGLFKANVSTIFPSITHAALPSLVTGVYPQEHGILGSYWFDVKNEEVAYYSADFELILSQGIGNFFEEFILNLNHKRLCTKTLFQIVEKARLRAASLNYLVFHGNVKHNLNVPMLLNMLPNAPSKEKIYGPSVLHLGDFVSHSSNGVEATELEKRGGLLNWMGLNDDSTADLLVQLAQQRGFPDFTVAYFPENDADSHRVGPEMALSTLEHLDKRLGEVIAAYGGLDAMLADLCVIVTADHAQVEIVADENKAGIRLDEMLADFKIAPAGKPWRTEDEVMICPNLRAAQIYFKALDPKPFHDVIAMLLADKRIDQVIWQADITEEGNEGYRIATADRGALHFWPGKSRPKTGVDAFGNQWSWAGDLRTVDGRLSEEKTLSFPRYPNAFERIAGLLESKQSGHIWITAQPGYEFSIDKTTVHAGGGSHGSLHASDSLAPILIAGAPSDLYLTDHFRIIDVAPLCLSILGLEPIRPIGANTIHQKELT